jgi:hypothetical protein
MTFAAGFADALNAGLDRLEKRKYYEARAGGKAGPNYDDIDRAHGQGGGGLGGMIRGARSDVSDWLHRNTGGILGHSQNPDPWNEKITPGAGSSVPTYSDSGSFGSSEQVSDAAGGFGGESQTSAVPLEQSGARGGLIRNYRDGGYAVRSFQDGGDVRRAPFELYNDQSPRDPTGAGSAPYEGVPQMGGLTSKEIEDNITAEINRRLGSVPREASPAPSGQWEQEGLSERGRQGIEAREQARGDAVRAKVAGIPQSDFEGSMPDRPPPPVPPRNVRQSDFEGSLPDRPAPTTSAAGRLVRRALFGNEDPAQRERDRVYFDEAEKLAVERRALTDPFEQKTAAKKAADEAALKENERKTAELMARRDAEAKQPPTSVAGAAKAAAAGTTTPAGPASPAGAARPAPEAVPLGVTGGAGSDVLGGGSLWARTINTPGAVEAIRAAAPSPQAPKNTGPAQTTSAAGTGGGQGAAPVATPPPGATTPATPTAPTAPAAPAKPAQDVNKAYDPDIAGPGNIPPGTIVTGSKGVPTAVAGAVPVAPGAGGAGGRPMTQLERDVANANQQGRVSGQDIDLHDGLYEALAGGHRHLMNAFDQNSTTAVPGAPNPQRDAGRMALHQGYGGPKGGPKTVADIDHALQAHGEKVSNLDQWQAKRLVRGYQFYKMRGDTKMADAFAGELLQHHNLMLQHYGHGALDALHKGDHIKATDHIIEGYNIHVPDGLNARKGEGNTVEFVNPKGTVVSKISYTPQNLWTAATGMSNGSLFHRELEHRVRNSEAYRKQMKEARAEAREDRQARHQELSDERLRQLLLRGQGSGGGGAPAVANPFGYANGGAVPSQGVQSFQDGGAAAAPAGFFTNRDALVPPEELEAARAEVARAEAVPLDPNVPREGFFQGRPGMAPMPKVAPDQSVSAPPGAVPLTPAPAPSQGQDQEREPVQAVSPLVETPDPYRPPEDVYHDGKLVPKQVEQDYALANPDDPRPSGRADPDHPDHYPDPNWRQNIQKMLGSGNKAIIQQARGFQKQHTEDVAKFKRDQLEWNLRAAAFKDRTKLERETAEKDRREQARATHGKVLSGEQLQTYATDADTAITNYKPTDKEKADTVFGQSITMPDGKVRPVVDPKTNRQLVMELGLTNNMTLDQATDVYAQLTGFDDANPNFRAYHAKGHDPAGNVIIRQLIPRRDIKGRIIEKKPGEPVWSYGPKEIHIKPAEYELLNNVVARRFEASKVPKEPDPGILSSAGRAIQALVGR